MIKDILLKKARENAKAGEKEFNENMEACIRDTGSADDVMDYHDAYLDMGRNEEVKKLALELLKDKGFDKTIIIEYAKKNIEYAEQEISIETVIKNHPDNDDIIESQYRGLDSIGDELEELEEKLGI